MDGQIKFLTGIFFIFIFLLFCIYWMQMWAYADDLSVRPCLSNKCTMFMLFLTPRFIIIAFKLQLKINVTRGLFSRHSPIAQIPTCMKGHIDTHTDKTHSKMVKSQRYQVAVHLEPFQIDVFKSTKSKFICREKGQFNCIVSVLFPPVASVFLHLCL